VKCTFSPKYLSSDGFQFQAYVLSKDQPFEKKKMKSNISKTDCQKDQSSKIFIILIDLMVRV